MATAKEIGKIFQSAREKLKLTRDEACHKSRIHTSIISKIEDGAFNDIGQIYLKSFMKKYSEFLGLEHGAIMTEFENIPSSEKGIKFSPDVRKREEKKATPEEIISGDGLNTVVITVLTVVLVIVALVGAMMLRAKLMPVSGTRAGKPSIVKIAKREEKVPADTRAKKEAPKEAPVSTVAKIDLAKEEKSRMKIPLFKVQADKIVTLELSADEDVWMEISDEKEKLFSGILRAGTKKEWEGEGPFTIWTGKAEKLKFSLNGRSFGKIASGVVKNIKVSRDGILVGASFVARLD